MHRDMNFKSQSNNQSRPCRAMQGESENDMLESRNSYGYGYVGSEEKGFEWLLIYGEHYHQRIKSGYVYKTERQALKEGNKFLEETVKKILTADYVKDELAKKEIKK